MEVGDEESGGIKKLAKRYNKKEIILKAFGIVESWSFFKEYEKHVNLVS